jgi:hypothetical protein
MPREVQRPFALARAGLSLRVGDDTPADRVCRALDHSAERVGGTRYRAWLGDRVLVDALVRAVLGDWTSPHIERTTLRRLKTDLTADRQARIALKAAQRRHQARAQAPKTRQVRAARERQCQLHLARGEDRIRLLLSLPPLPASVTAEALPLLRRRRYSARLWGVSRPILSDRLLSGVPFEIEGIDEWPGRDSTLLPGLETDDLPAALSTVLSGLRASSALPILFQVRKGGTDAVQVLGGQATGGYRYWVLTGYQPDECAVIERLGSLVGGLWCSEVDTSVSEGRDWLRKIGITVVQRASVRWIGAPSLTPLSSTAAHLPEDLVALWVGVPDGETVEVTQQVRSKSASVTLTEPGTIRLSPQGPETLVTVRTGEGREEELRVELERAPDSVAACTLTLEGDVHSLGSVIRRELSLRVESPVQLENVSVVIEARVAGEVRRVTRQLGVLPATIGPSDYAWSRLLDEATQRRAARSGSVEISAHVGAIASGRWVLEREVAPVWWELGEAGLPEAVPPGSCRLPTT